RWATRGQRIRFVRLGAPSFAERTRDCVRDRNLLEPGRDNFLRVASDSSGQTQSLARRIVKSASPKIDNRMRNISPLLLALLMFASIVHAQSLPDSRVK